MPIEITQQYLDGLPLKVHFVTAIYTPETIMINEHLNEQMEKFLKGDLNYYRVMTESPKIFPVHNSDIIVVVPYKEIPFTKEQIKAMSRDEVEEYANYEDVLKKHNLGWESVS